MLVCPPRLLCLAQSDFFQRTACSDQRRRVAQDFLTACFCDGYWRDAFLWANPITLDTNDAALDCEGQPLTKSFFLSKGSCSTCSS
jgi:hypothetical protein